MWFVTPAADVDASHSALCGSPMRLSGSGSLLKLPTLWQCHRTHIVAGVNLRDNDTANAPGHVVVRRCIRRKLMGSRRGLWLLSLLRQPGRCRRCCCGPDPLHHEVNCAQVLPCFAAFCRVLSRFAPFLLCFAPFYRVLPHFDVFFRVLPRFVTL